MGSEQKDQPWVMEPSTGRQQSEAGEEPGSLAAADRQGAHPAQDLRPVGSETSKVDDPFEGPAYYKVSGSPAPSLPDRLVYSRRYVQRPCLAFRRLSRDARSLGAPDNAGSSGRIPSSIPLAVWVPLGLYFLHHSGDRRWMLACLSEGSPVPADWRGPDDEPGRRPAPIPAADGTCIPPADATPPRGIDRISTGCGCVAGFALAFNCAESADEVVWNWGV
jgi:hypothetical protein